MKQDRRFILNAELRAGMSEGDEPALVIDGRAVGYDKLSLPGVPFAGCKERIRPGAFANSLKSGKVVLANYNHENACLPLGSTRNGSLILHDIASSGLHFELRLDRKVSLHRDLHRLVQNGTVGECSFEFGVPDGGDEYTDLVDDEDRCHQLRSVKQAELYAITLTPNPAYGNEATFAAARSLAYSFGTARRPTMNAAELRKQVDHISNVIACDQAELFGGFHQVHVGPGEADVKFIPFGPGDLQRHLLREHKRIGDEIREQHCQWLVDEIASERKDPTNVFDPHERLYRPRLEVLEKELAALVEGEIL